MTLPDPLTADAVIAHCRENDRACPMPDYWARLYKMLPNTGLAENGITRIPGLPLILGAWHDSSPSSKAERLAEHIRWAEQEGVLERVAEYLFDLPEPNWFHVDD